MIVVSDTTPLISLLKVNRLDLGESEAIVLADTLGADLTILDDGNARRVAMLEGMNITGTVGVLGKAYTKGFLTADELRRCVEVLRTSKRYISESLLNRLLAMV